MNFGHGLKKERKDKDETQQINGRVKGTLERLTWRSNTCPGISCRVFILRHKPKGSIPWIGFFSKYLQFCGLCSKSLPRYHPWDSISSSEGQGQLPQCPSPQDNCTELFWHLFPRSFSFFLFLLLQIPFSQSPIQGSFLL